MVKRKAGRPPRYVTGRDGKPVVGLSRETKSERYYATGSKPRVYFGRDHDSAVIAFRSWENTTSGRPATVAIANNRPCSVRLPIPDAGNGPVFTVDFDPRNGHRPVRVANEVPESWRKAAPGLYSLVTEDALWAFVRQQIIDKPHYVAERTGIEQIGYLVDLQRPEPSMPLADVWRVYASKKRSASSTWKRDAKRYWDEFAAAANAKTLRDITAEDIERFHDGVWRAKEKNNRSAAYVNHRLTTVTAVLRYALKRGRDVVQLRRVIDLCALFERERNAELDPRPISPEVFAKLLGTATIKFKAIMLTALNMCMYPSEVAALRRDEIDFKRKSYVGRRSKTGVVRVGLLWDRTIAVINEYLQEEPHDAANLFVSATGKAYSANHIGRNFRRIRAAAGVGDDVVFSMIRDASFSSAVEGGADLDHIRLLAGHRLPGVTDAYVRRNPRMVSDAVAAIESAYFGSPSAA